MRTLTLSSFLQSRSAHRRLGESFLPILLKGASQVRGHSFCPLSPLSLQAKTVLETPAASSRNCGSILMCEESGGESSPGSRGDQASRLLRSEQDFLVLRGAGANS